MPAPHNAEGHFLSLGRSLDGLGGPPAPRLLQSLGRHN